jgi:hypothetical protein
VKVQKRRAEKRDVNYVIVNMVAVIVSVIIIAVASTGKHQSTKPPSLFKLKCHWLFLCKQDLTQSGEHNHQHQNSDVVEITNEGKDPNDFSFLLSFSWDVVFSSKICEVMGF